MRLLYCIGISETAYASQQRSWRHAVAQALGLITAFGRRTLSRAIWAPGREEEDWSAADRLDARSE